MRALRFGPLAIVSAVVVLVSLILAAFFCTFPWSMTNASSATPADSTASRMVTSADLLVRAAEAPVAPRPDSVAPAPTHQPPAVAGMVVGIDPETGKLGMPTPEQMEELSGLQQREVDHSSDGLVEVHHPDGSVSVDLQGRFQEFATVRIGPNGKLTFQCVDGAENAERALKDPPADNAPGRPVAEER